MRRTPKTSNRIGRRRMIEVRPLERVAIYLRPVGMRIGFVWLAPKEASS